MKSSLKKYSNDAFSLNLQGILYEMNGDINNAFISYRNATDIYLNKGNNYYGVQIPKQLQTDLIKTADELGFSEEKERYEKLFNMQADTIKNKSELILFLEEGNAPIKEETSFTIVYNNGQAMYQFVDQYGVFHSSPFDYRSNGINGTKLSDIKTFKIALPTYRIVYPNPASISVSLNNNIYTPEITQNLNSLSLSLLQERFLSDLAKSVLRYLVKHSVEKGSNKIATRIAEKNKKSSSDSESEKKKKEENAKAIGDAVGFFVGLTNTVTEKADTRCWHSLPAYIHYVRIPLQQGENTIDVNFHGKQKTIQMQGKNGIQIKCLNL
jgi:hypothetical protein